MYRLFCKYKQEIDPKYSPEAAVETEERVIHIRYRVISPIHIQFNRNDTLQVAESTPYYDVIKQLYKLIKPSLGYESESIELYNETGYPLVTIPAYYLYPIRSWLLRSEDLIYAIPKALLPPSTRTLGDIKHSITIQTTDEEITLDIEIRTSKKDNGDISGEDIKRAISHHLHLPTYCIYLYYRPVTNRLSNQLEDSQTVNLKSIKDKETIILFDLSEEYWAPTSLDTYSSALTRPCGMLETEYPILHTFNAELMYFTRVLTDRSKDEQLLFLGSLRKNSCSPPLVYAFFLITQGSFISLPHKIAILEGLSMILSFTVENTYSITEKLPLFAKICAYVERSAIPGDRNTEQYDFLYLPARLRMKSHDDNIKRMSMSFPDEQKEMIIWSSVRRVTQKFSTKILLDDSVSFPRRHPVELMFDFMHNRNGNGLMSPLNRTIEKTVVFTGRSNEAYKYLKFYSPLEGKAITFHPHDFVVRLTTLADDPQLGDISNCIMVLLDLSNEMIRSDLHKPRTAKSGCTLITTGIILINAIIDRLIRQETNCLLGLYIFSNDRPEEEFNRLLVPPTFSYNDVVVAMDTTLQFLVRPSIAKQTRSTENKLAKGIDFCTACYPNSNLICIANQTEVEITLITSLISCMVLFGGKNKNEINREKVKMLIDDKKIDRFVSNEQSKVMKYPFSECRLIEYIDMIENHIRIENNLVNALQKPNVKDFNDYEEQLHVSGDKYTSTTTPADVLAILKEVTRYMHNPNPYAKIFSNGSLKDWSITFDFHGVIPKIELLMHLPARYPSVAPKFRLLCGVHHCNVDKHGNVCHPILYEGYRQGVSLRKVIDAIYNMLITPVPSHAVQTKELLLYYSNHKDSRDSILISSFMFDKIKITRTQSTKLPKVENFMSFPYLICPLTNRLFENPVITPDGHTFDRDAVLLYMNLNHKDPVSGSSLVEEDLTPNKSIADGVAKYKRTISTHKFWWEKKS